MSKKDDLLKKEFYNLMNSMLEYNGYHATVTYDADDNLFVGEVFGISDSLNFHGSSIDELSK